MYLPKLELNLPMMIIQKVILKTVRFSTLYVQKAPNTGKAHVCIFDYHIHSVD